MRLSMDGMERIPRNGIGERLAEIRKRIGEACRRANRDPRAVTLVAVSKLKPFSDIMQARRAGANDFGENYVQELTAKLTEAEKNADQESEPIRWHMIGHLQRNKVRSLMGRTVLIHSVDSPALAEQIEKESARAGITTDILLEVNAAGEETKWGFRPEEVLRAAEQIQSLSHVRLRGLMTSAPLTEDPETNRPYFRHMKELAEELTEKGLISHDPFAYTLPVLSMGMSGDYEVALEEGATMIRIGTAVFGERHYPKA